jgi:thermitase
MTAYWQSLEHQPISLVLAVVGGVLFALQGIARERNRAWSPLVTLTILGIIGLAGAYRWVWGSDTLWATARDCATDLGIGAVLGVLVLLVRRGSLSILLGPAIVLVLAAGGMHLAEGLGIWVRNAITGQNNIYTIEANEAEWVVQLGRDDDISELAELLARHSAVAERMFPDLTPSDDAILANTFLVRCPMAQASPLLNALALDTENVLHTERNEALRLPNEPSQAAGPEPAPAASPDAANDPRLAEQFWLAGADGPELFRLLARARVRRKAVVAILDTGVDGSHPDLAADPDSPSLSDPHGHGTHCAGLAAAVANNGRDIASLNWEGRFIELRSYSALNGSGFGTNESVARAIVAAAKAGADVISLSLGTAVPGTEPVGLHADAIRYALRKKCIVVCAAGNDAADARKHSPSNVRGVIAVAAVDAENRRATFSNTNAGLGQPIAAPGVGILSLKPGGGTVQMSGTSMATPIVAGLLGIMRALDPGISAQRAYSILRDTGTPGPDARQVGKTINPLRALRQL